MNAITSSNSELTTMPFISSRRAQCFSMHDNKKSTVEDGIDFTTKTFRHSLSSFVVAVAMRDNRNTITPSINPSDTRLLDCNLIKRKEALKINVN
jgi:hypothetical protein